MDAPTASSAVNPELQGMSAQFLFRTFLYLLSRLSTLKRCHLLRPCSVGVVQHELERWSVCHCTRLAGGRRQGGGTLNGDRQLCPPTAQSPSGGHGIDGERVRRAACTGERGREEEPRLPCPSRVRRGVGGRFATGSLSDLAAAPSRRTGDKGTPYMTMSSRRSPNATPSVLLNDRR